MVGPIGTNDPYAPIYYDWFTNVRLRALLTGDIALTNALINLGATNIQGSLKSSEIVSLKFFL